MTPDPGALRDASRPMRTLRGRLLVAFLAVAVVAVALVTAAALVGTSAGLSAQEQSNRDETTRRVAAVTAESYRRAGGWDDVVLDAAVSVATGAGARLIVRDSGGDTVLSTAGLGRMNGMGNGMGNGSGNGMGNGSGDGMGPGAGVGQGAATGVPVVQSVQVGATTVGSVTLIFPAATAATGRPVAWRWIGVAAAGALALAFGAAWIITRSLTRPLAVLTGTARAFATGDHGARTRLHAHGQAPDELSSLAAAFDEAAERVQLSEQTRRQMAADVAHELRTPLAALQAGLEELRDGLAPADADALARLHDQSLRLGRVVTDLADLSAADAARLTLRPEPTDLALIAKATVEAHDAPLRAAGLSIVTDLDQAVPLLADPGRLHQIVGNLLQNCARHCRPGDSVTVGARSLRDGHAVLTVADTGPGISATDLPHVFTRFWRSGTSAGSGLGMPIVRSLVEAHGGGVEITSDGRSGTTVTIRLPSAGPGAR